MLKNMIEEKVSFYSRTFYPESPAFIGFNIFIKILATIN